MPPINNIICVLIVFIVTTANANAINTLEYSAKVERGCPFDLHELEAMIETVLHSGSITPTKVKTVNRQVIHLDVHLKCNRQSVIKNTYTLVQKIRNGGGLLHHPQVWVIDNKNGTNPKQNRDMIKLKITQAITSLVRNRFSRN